MSYFVTFVLEGHDIFDGIPKPKPVRSNAVQPPMPTQHHKKPLAVAEYIAQHDLCSES